MIASRLLNLGPSIVKFSSQKSTHSPTRLPPTSFLITVLVFAAGIRFAASTGALWLDEIWSLELAHEATSSAAVLTDLRTDNNHVLNTLYLRAIGPNRPPIVYRLPAILFGTASVLLGGMIASRWGQTTAAIAATLLASSYLLVHYSSEARGYAPAIFFALVGTESLLRQLEFPSWHWVVTFWSSCLLGVLSHPIFTHFMFGIACWSVSVLSARTMNWKATIRHELALFGIPVIVASLIYWTMWRNLDLGGGPAYSLIEVAMTTASLALGGPAIGWGAIIASIIFVGISVSAFWVLREDELHSGLLLTVTIVTPFALAVGVRPPFLFPRYFLISVLFAMFALAIVLGKLHTRGRLGQTLASLLLLIYIAANLIPTIRLVTVGRGQYLAALNYMAQKTGQARLTISSDHNFGVRKLIEFHSPLMDPPTQIQYFNGNQWPPEGPDWLVLHRYTESSADEPSEVFQIDGHRFQKERVFNCSILSGWQWWCYRQMK